MDVETDPARRLGDHRARLERVVNALDRVVLHAHEEARRELRVRRAGVEERGRSVGEITLRHEVVALDDGRQVAPVDADADPHEQVLRALGHLAVDAQQIRPLERLEAKVVLSAVSLRSIPPADARS